MLINQKRCDRCHYRIDLTDINSEAESKWQTLFHHPTSMTEADYDLCPKCFQLFKSWMEARLKEESDA